MNDRKCIPKLAYSKLYCLISSQSFCYVFQPATRDLLGKKQYRKLRSIFFSWESFLRTEEQTAKRRYIRRNLFDCQCGFVPRVQSIQPIDLIRAQQKIPESHCIKSQISMNVGLFFFEIVLECFPRRLF